MPYSRPVLLPSKYPSQPNCGGRANARNSGKAFFISSHSFAYRNLSICIATQTPFVKKWGALGPPVDCEPKTALGEFCFGHLHRAVCRIVVFADERDLIAFDFDLGDLPVIVLLCEDRLDRHVASPPLFRPRRLAQARRNRLF